MARLEVSAPRLDARVESFRNHLPNLDELVFVVELAARDRYHIDSLGEQSVPPERIRVDLGCAGMEGVAVVFDADPLLWPEHIASQMIAAHDAPPCGRKGNLLVELGFRQIQAALQMRQAKHHGKTCFGW